MTTTTANNFEALTLWADRSYCDTKRTPKKVEDVAGALKSRPRVNCAESILPFHIREGGAMSERRKSERERVEKSN